MDTLQKGQYKMDAKTVLIIVLIICGFLIGYKKGQHDGFDAGIMAQITGGIRFKIDDSEDEEDNEN